MAETKQPNQQLTNAPLDPGTATTRMNLIHDVTVNGVTYRKGNNVEVPKKQADDIARIDHDHQKTLNDLHIKHDHTVNAGSISVGSGAE